MYDSIKFTIERESDQKLPFLDMMLTRKTNTIEISVYRKPTSTDRYIPFTSSTSYQHKMAAFNSMTYRLCRLPLNARIFKEEVETIKRIANINGYKSSKIEELVRKHSKNMKRRNLTTLEKEKTQSEFKLCKFSYLPNFSYKISKVMRKVNVQCVFGNSGKVKEILGNTKDKTNSLAKPGIYSLSCQDCTDEYIGQTKRSISVRFKEHMNC